MIALHGRRWGTLLAGATVCFLFAGAARACIAENSGPTGPPAFAHPMPGAIQSAFGIRIHPLLNRQRAHNGIDYVASVGDPVQAAAAGEIVEAAPKGEFGNAVLIRHAGGWETFYAHLNRFSVRAGECVKAGDVIASAGNTGFSAGPQMHFETRKDGTHVDPMTILPSGRPLVEPKW